MIVRWRLLIPIRLLPADPDAWRRAVAALPFNSRHDVDYAAHEINRLLSSPPPHTATADAFGVGRVGVGGGGAARIFR